MNDIVSRAEEMHGPVENLRASKGKVEFWGGVAFTVWLMLVKAANGDDLQEYEDSVVRWGHYSFGVELEMKSRPPVFQFRVGKNNHQHSGESSEKCHNPI